MNGSTGTNLLDVSDMAHNTVAIDRSFNQLVCLFIPLVRALIMERGMQSDIESGDGSHRGQVKNRAIECNDNHYPLRGTKNATVMMTMTDDDDEYDNGDDDDDDDTDDEMC